MGKFIDLTDKIFGKWKVLQRINRNIKKTEWLCICECGFNSIVNASHLVGGKSSQCKTCHNKQAIKKRPLKHGHSYRNNKSLTYQSWSAMRNRCVNKEDSHWPYYGGRGISFCETWNDFNVFLKDMGNRPENHTLDRIDNSGNYCKSNCKWSSSQTQSENKRNNIYLEKDGKIQTKTQWARDYGMPFTSFSRWLKKYGWPFNPPKETNA